MDQLKDQQGISRVNPKGLPNPRQRIHRTKKYNKTALALSRTKGHNLRVLVVDDEEGIRHALSITLSAMGYEALSASTGTEAFNLFLRNSFDLVITDLQMPGMDGLNLSSHIKDKFPNIPIILITGQAKEDVMKRMEASCVDFVLFKPVRLDDILKTAQKMLGVKLSERSASSSSNNPQSHQNRSR